MPQMVERGFFKSSIQLASANGLGGKPTSPGLPTSLGNPDVQVLRVGKFNHPKYGEFEITSQTLAEMKENFDAKVRGVDVAFDYFHNSDQEASGWPTDLYLNEEETELWARVDWTPSAQRKLQEREIRYFSPDFAFIWEDPETGKIYKNVLFGGGLTNRPFVKDMAAIVAAEQKEEQMKLEDLEKKVLKLAEDGADLAKQHADLKVAHAALQGQHAELQKKMAEYAEKSAPAAAPAPAEEGEPDEDDVEGLKKKLAEVDGRNKSLEKELADMKSAKQMAEKESAFNVLLTEGKACVAQKDSYLKGDMNEFIKLAQPMNMSGNGSSGNGGSESGDKEDRILKLAEEKCKADPKLSKLEAIKLAQREVR